MPCPDVNLAELMPALDSAAEELVEHQRDAVTQRKDLAQKTKDFRKLDDQSKLAEIKGLLKCLSIAFLCEPAAEPVQPTRTSSTS